jgi:predicted histidine transporter YuiF (NhaC family)
MSMSEVGMDIHIHELAVCWPEMTIGVLGILAGVILFFWAEHRRKKDINKEREERLKDREKNQSERKEFRNKLLLIKNGMKGSENDDLKLAINDLLEELKTS